jgi:hypothetical protein
VHGRILFGKNNNNTRLSITQPSHPRLITSSPHHLLASSPPYLITQSRTTLCNG